MPKSSRNDERRFSPWEEQEVAAAARDAGAIGGRAGDEDLDPAQRPLAEAGEGVAEGFELAEDELIEAAQHGSSQANPIADALTPETDGSRAAGDYGEADHEESTGGPDSDR
jgi:hypothetical protein